MLLEGADGLLQGVVEDRRSGRFEEPELLEGGAHLGDRGSGVTAAQQLHALRSRRP